MADPSSRDNEVDCPPRGLTLAIQCWPGDVKVAMRVARLIADIEPARRSDVSLAFCPRFDVDEFGLAEIARTRVYCGHKLGTFLVEQPEDRRGTGHPAGPNDLWAGVMDVLSRAWQAGETAHPAVFFVESDGCPLRADWIDMLLRSHRAATEIGKRVTGCATFSGGVPHINGSLIAELSLWLDRPSLHRTPPKQAWDLFHARVLLAEGANTSAIKNVYGARGWSPEALTAMAKETAWLASTKDGSALAWAEVELPHRARAPLPAGCVVVEG